MSTYINGSLLLSILAGIAGVSVAIAAKAPFNLAEFAHPSLRQAEIMWKLAMSGSFPTAVCYLLFYKWLWRWRVFYPWLVKYPNLSGSWEGVSRSETFGDSRPVSVRIEQRIDKIIYVEETPKAINTSESVTLIRHGIDCKLFITYESRPKGNYPAPNTGFHTGSCVLTVRGVTGARASEGTTLEGGYWTNKNRMNPDKAPDCGTVGGLCLRWKSGDMVATITSALCDDSPIT